MGARLLLCLVNDVSEYQRMLAADAETAARRAGFTLEVHQGDDSVTTQIRKVREAIGRPRPDRPYAILMFPARDAAMEKVAQDVVEAGVGWILLNRRADYIAALRQRAPGLPISAVGPDQHEVGRLQARQVCTLLPAGGPILYVLGTTLTSAAQNRRAGLREGLAGTKVNLSEITGSWRTVDADQAVGTWLEMVVPTGLRPGVVACQNDPMALGARQALERVAAQLKKPELATVPVTGVDGMERVGKKLVNEGRLTATVVQPSSAGPAIDLLAGSTKGAPVPPSIVLPLESFPALERLQAARR